jgi:hypothetical protein
LASLIVTVSNRSSFSFSLGKSLHSSPNERVVIPFLEKDGHDGQVSVLVGMNQVRHHIVSFAVDLLFAGPVKMELFQNVFGAATLSSC